LVIEFGDPRDKHIIQIMFTHSERDFWYVTEGHTIEDSALSTEDIGDLSTKAETLFEEKGK